ncbi:MAG: monovalent cation/H+ antiporter complex subunit F [Dethiobacteria bacterium]|jgi:multisubunit Na+/H+ antiporter MnhF subunit
MLDAILNFYSIGLALLGLAAFYRAYTGPSATDRIVAMNMINTMIVLYILIYSYRFDQYHYIDVALLFVLAGFAATLAILKLLRDGRII